MKYKIGSITSFINLIYKSGKTAQDLKEELLNKYKDFIEISERTKTPLKIVINKIDFECVIVSQDSYRNYKSFYVEIHPCYFSKDERFINEYDDILRIVATRNDNNHEELIFVISNRKDFDSCSSKFLHEFSYESIDNCINEFIEKNSVLLEELFKIIKDKPEVYFRIHYHNKENFEESKINKSDVKIEFIRYDPELEGRSRSIMGAANFGTFYITED